MQNCNKDLFKPYNSNDTSFFVHAPLPKSISCTYTSNHLHFL